MGTKHMEPIVTMGFFIERIEQPEKAVLFIRSMSFTALPPAVGRSMVSKDEN
jgi:hypothetical protein